jgi:hypothetical protein
MEDGAVGHHFERKPPKDLPSKIWFRGEDLTVKVYDVQHTPSDGKSQANSNKINSKHVFRTILTNIKHSSKK